MPDTGTVRQMLVRRRRAADWSEEEVVVMARHADFVVHKYRHTHEKLRKLTRRMCRDGKLKMVMFDGQQFYYRTPKEKS
jgi:hypothetical protein